MPIGQWGARAALCVVLSFSIPARAEDPSTTTPDPAAERAAQLRAIDGAIAQQHERRHHATAAFVVAGVVLVGGIIASAVETANDEEEAQKQAQQNGQSTYQTKIDWTGFAIGALIAAPIIVGGVSTLRDVHRQTRALLLKRRQLTLAPGPGLLNLTYRF